MEVFNGRTRMKLRSNNARRQTEQFKLIYAHLLSQSSNLSALDQIHTAKALTMSKNKHGGNTAKWKADVLNTILKLLTCFSVFAFSTKKSKEAPLLYALMDHTTTLITARFPEGWTRDNMATVIEKTLNKTSNNRRNKYAASEYADLCYLTKNSKKGLQPLIDLKPKVYANGMSTTQRSFDETWGFIINLVGRGKPHNRMMKYYADPVLDSIYNGGPKNNMRSLVETVVAKFKDVELPNSLVYKRESIVNQLYNNTNNNNITNDNNN